MRTERPPASARRGRAEPLAPTVPCPGIPPPGPPPTVAPAAHRRVTFLDTRGVRLNRDDLRLLALLAEGMPISSISRRLAMSDRTIRRRIRAICEQLGVKSTVQAIVWAARRGLV